MESLLKMTWEQIEYLVEGIVWNLNAQTKEGQKRNEKEWRLKNLNDEMKEGSALQEKIRRLDERIKKRNLKK